MDYNEFYKQSIDDPETVWGTQAKRIEWRTPHSHVLDYSKPPFSNWFVGGETNLCHNAIDRWVDKQGDQTALIAISTETPDAAPVEKTWSYRELQREVERTAAIMQSLGVGKGDMVQPGDPVSTELPASRPLVIVQLD